MSISFCHTSPDKRNYAGDKEFRSPLEQKYIKGRRPIHAVVFKIICSRPHGKAYQKRTHMPYSSLYTFSFFIVILSMLFAKVLAYLSPGLKG